MTVQWYYRRIRRLISDISDATKAVLPANRQQVQGFVSSWSVILVEDILSGLRDVSDWDSMDWESNRTFLKFKDHILDVERDMGNKLQQLRFMVEPNTLTVVAGEGRLEKVCDVRTQ